MFPNKPPDKAQLKLEYDKRQHIKNAKAIEKTKKEKKLAEIMKLELNLKAAAKNKAGLVKKNQTTPSTSFYPRLASNFKIPKKKPAQSVGQEKQQQDPRKPQATPVPNKGRQCDSGSREASDRRKIIKHPETVQQEPMAPSLFEVQKWLIASEEGGKKPFRFQQPVVIEDTRNSFDLDEEEPMVIDTDEVVGCIHEIRGAGIYDGERVYGQLTKLSRNMSVSTEQTCMVPEIRNNKEILLVLDTNVLASDLGLVDDLRRSWTGENGSTKLVLMVPWIVLQELDNLKEDRRGKKPALKTLAAGAVRYLHDLLTSGNSQIRGQTILETYEDVGWEITCNDDRILQCCFQCKKRGGGNVVLFSNDRNLCNKAMVNRLQACSKETVVQVLEKMAPLPASRKRMLDPSYDGKVESGSKLCNEIVCQTKNILHDILESVLKTEMIKAFDELWTSIVKIKPPWRLEDILKCLKMHWIAVFGQILPKKAREHLDIICAKFTLNQGAFSKDDVKELLVASLRFLSYFENTGAVYSERVTPSIHQIRNLLDVVKNIRLATYQVKVGESSQRATHPEANIAQQNPLDIIEVREYQEVPEIPPDPHEYLKNTLRMIWNFMNNTSGLIYDSLGLPNPIEYQRPDKLLSQMEAKNTIPPFYSTITELGKLMESVLKLGESFSPADEKLAKLAYYLDNFFFILGKDSEMKIDENISVAALHQFCTTQETRQKLIAGFHQLEDLCNLLYRCILDIRGKDASEESTHWSQSIANTEI